MPRRFLLRRNVGNGTAAAGMFTFEKKYRQSVAGAIALANGFGYHAATLKVLHR
jgi:hypothetical protein